MTTQRVQEVVMMIFDKAAQQQSLIDLQLDSRQIASVTDSKIKEAYKLLNQLENAIQLKNSNSTSVKEEALKSIKNLSSSFYSLIPHSAKDPPSIDNPDLLKQKLSMLEVLTDIQIANRITSDISSDASNTSIKTSYSISTVDLYYKFILLFYF